MSDQFDLRVVPLADIVPHEEPEPRRVARIVGRLATDTHLANPPLVAETDAGLVLLDGANRTSALRMLDYRFAIVQVVQPSEVRLTMWHHALLDTTPDRLAELLRDVEEIELDGAAPPIATVRLGDGRVTTVSPRHHPFEALGALVGAYVDRAVIRRTTDPRVATHPDAAAVVEFVPLTTDEVFGAVRDGQRMPAGITRFVVSGRVIQLNAPLDPLRSDLPVDELSGWLAGLVAGRRADGRVRHYPEAVFVLDD